VQRAHEVHGNILMETSRRSNKIFLALCLNAAMLLAILLALASRDGRLTLASPALAETSMPSQAPIAGAGGLFIMPAQLSPNTWGCYLMDIDNQTLCVYQYSPGEKMLRLTAARNVQYDRRLGNFNTAPAPQEVKNLVEREQESQRAMPPKSPQTQK
jgi:hypothetical protein